MTSIDEAKAKMTEIDIECTQEQAIIGHFVCTVGDKITVTPHALITNYRPTRNVYMFLKRPREGQPFLCPRCSGPLRVRGSASFDKTYIGEDVDGLLVGQFEVRG